MHLVPSRRRNGSAMKRLMDIILVVLSAPAWGPIMLALMFQVRRKLGSPVFFRQPRTGLNGETFQMMKFRTMTDERDAKGELLPDAQRLTAFGKWLRSTSLDELPELLVILKGDMSLVGPRPLLPRYLPRYTPEQTRRHEVKPGLTGWAQVNGRNAISWEEKFRLDVWYVDHQSLFLDLKIIFMTLMAVIKREGISATNDATMPEFMGSPVENPSPYLVPPSGGSPAQPTPAKLLLPSILAALLIAAFWAFPYFWYNQTPPGNFVWFAESTNVTGWTYVSTPISKIEETVMQADKTFSAEFKKANDSVLAFSAKRFSNDPNEKALFAHTPDRCWTQAGWRHEIATPDVIEVHSGGIELTMERRIFIWKTGQRLLVYFGGLSAGRPLPYRLDHELSVALRLEPNASYARGAQLRATDPKFWGNLWEAFVERRPMLGPKHFIRVATPITNPNLAEADQRLQSFLEGWLQPGDFAADAKSLDRRTPSATEERSL